MAEERWSVALAEGEAIQIGSMVNFRFEICGDRGERADPSSGWETRIDSKLKSEARLEHLYDRHA
jgi:hypothetical protein